GLHVAGVALEGAAAEVGAENQEVLVRGLRHRGQVGGRVIGEAVADGQQLDLALGFLLGHQSAGEDEQEAGEGFRQASHGWWKLPYVDGPPRNFTGPAVRCLSGWRWPGGLRAGGFV